MHPEGKISFGLAYALGAAMAASALAGSGGHVYDDADIYHPKPDAHEHQNKAFDRRHAISSARSGFAKAKRAKSRL